MLLSSLFVFFNFSATLKRRSYIPKELFWIFFFSKFHCKPRKIHTHEHTHTHTFPSHTHTTHTQHSHQKSTHCPLCHTHHFQRHLLSTLLVSTFQTLSILHVNGKERDGSDNRNRRTVKGQRTHRQIYAERNSAALSEKEDWAQVRAERNSVAYWRGERNGKTWLRYSPP